MCRPFYAGLLGLLLSGCAMVSPGQLARAERTHGGHEDHEIFVSDRRLKEDIQMIGHAANGLPIYLFRYKGDPELHMGVMAQDVLQQSPQAVIQRRDGYYMVDYGAITW
jgi:hypothetical protein